MAVYFIQSGPNGPVKIGHSQRVKKRLHAISGPAFARPVVLRTVAGGECEEGYFHHLFAANRLHGEWFSFDSAMLTAEAPALPDRLLGYGFAPMSIAIGIQQMGGLVATAKLFGVKPSAASQWIGNGQIPVYQQHPWFAIANERGIELPNRMFWNMYFPRLPGQPRAERPFARCDREKEVA